MSPAEIALLASSVGGLGGLGALITSLTTIRRWKRVEADTAQLRPNHGSSMADALHRIETMQRSQGHQLGEQHRLIILEMKARQALEDRATLEHAQIRDDLKKCARSTP